MSDGHHHHGLGGGWWNFPLGRVGWTLATLLVACTAVLLVGAIVLWPSGGDEGTSPLGQARINPVGATVTDIETAHSCTNLPEGTDALCDVVTFEITSGPTTGDSWSWELPASSRFAPEFDLGDDVYLSSQPDVPDERFRYSFIDFNRQTPLIWLGIMFAVAIVALGGFEGIRALISLALSLVALVSFTLPAILDGTNPVVVALIGSGIVALVALLLTHGVNHLTAVALLGSFFALGLTGGLAWVFLRATQLSGIADENVRLLLVGADGVDPRGLLLAGIVIGALGVLDDVTVTQAVTVSEIHAANPTYGRRRVYAAALRVGRSHIASTTNTLVLAYAGAALPLLLLFTQAQLSVNQVASSELIAVEIVRTAVGTIGLVSSVPITTALAVWVVNAKPTSTDPTTRRIQDDAGDGPSLIWADDPGTVSASPPRRPTWDDFSPRDFGEPGL